MTFLFNWKEYLPTTALAIIGAIVGALAVAIFVFSARFKSKERMLLVQSIGHAMLIFSEALSKAFASIIQELASIIRNILIRAGKNTNVVNIIIILFGFIFGLYCALFGVNTFTPWKGLNVSPWYGFLPVIANLEYSVVVLNKKISYKWVLLSFATSNFLWAFSFLLQGGSLLLSGILNMISFIAAFMRFLKECMKKEETEKDVDF